MHKVIDNGKSVLLSLARAVSASLLKKAMWMFLAMLESRNQRLLEKDGLSSINFVGMITMLLKDAEDEQDFRQDE